MSAGDGVDGATVFSMEKFATHEQIDKYQSLMQEYNSLVFHIILCLSLVLSNSFFLSPIP